MQCLNGNKRDGMALWPGFSEFVDNVSFSTLAPFKAKLWHKGKLRKTCQICQMVEEATVRRFFFDFTHWGQMPIFRSKTQFWWKVQNRIFHCEFWFLLKMGVSKGENIQILVIKKAEFYSLQNRESQGPFLKDHTAAAQQRSILWCNRGAVVNFWRLFLGLKKKDPKLAMPKWPEVTICRFVMPPQNISAKWNGGFFGAIIPRKYGSVRTKLLPIIIKRLDL